MVAGVPSLTGSLVLTDPQSIIAYTWTKFSRTPKDAVPILDSEIISLPWLVAQHGSEPDNLVDAIQSSLQGVLSRIFGQERTVTVNVSYITDSSSKYSVNVAIMYSTSSGEIAETGTTISLRDGRLVIPEYTLGDPFVR